MVGLIELLIILFVGYFVFGLPATILLMLLGGVLLLGVSM